MPGKESKDKPFIPTHTQRSEAADKDEQQKAINARIKDIRMAFALTFSTPDGKKVLRWIMEQAGFQKAQVGGNPTIGMNVMEGTLYNAARESLYIEIRSFIPVETLKEIEYQSVEETIV